MKIRQGQETIYADWFAKNDDDYGRRCFTYAEEWAALLEARMTADTTPQDVILAFAKEDSRTADTDGITGFMYGMAVSILAESWEHGEILRRWHNKTIQLGTEGDRANEEGGVLNPALLSLG